MKPSRSLFLSALVGVIAISATAAVAPIRLHPDNPHYFLHRGQPTVLLTVGEHYSSLLNLGFNFHTYYAALAQHGLNQTRVFSGSFRHRQEGYGAPLLKPIGRDNFIAPWAWSDQPGGIDGWKFDLDAWNPDYFRRLEELLVAAGQCGVVVEFVFFCTQYHENDWAASPLHPANNIQGIGNLKHPHRFLTLTNPELVKRQQHLVRRLVQACRGHDNVYFEIANEPFWARRGDPGITPEERAAWQNVMLKTVAEEEASLPAAERHMIAVNEWHETMHAPLVSVLAYHYVQNGDHMGAMQALDNKYGADKALVFDETEYGNSSRVRRFTAADMRAEAWEFMIGGGSGYSNLATYDYSAEDEGGATKQGEVLRASVGALKRFFGRLDLPRMRRDPKVIVAGVPVDAFARAISDPGKCYVAYVHHSNYGGLAARPKRKPSYEVRPGNYQTGLTLDLPAGRFEIEWTNPADLKRLGAGRISHSGGHCILRSPFYPEDIALTVRAVE